MVPFGRWLRGTVAPDGLPDTVLGSIAGALAWIITVLLKAAVANLFV
jgi:hypothetical protein